MSPLSHLYIFAGLSFAFALINIVVGLQKGTEKPYLIFGIISLCIGIYYLMFPMSISLPVPNIYGKIGLLFFIVAFGFFPWFIKHYGECRKSIMPWILSGGMAIVMMLFLYQQNADSINWWNLVAHIVLVGIAFYGFLVAYTLWEKQIKRSAIYLLIAQSIFFLLIIDDIIYVHFNELYLFDLPAGILPFDYFFITFMIIMGVRLSGEILHKTYLENQSILQEKRWLKLLEEVELIVVEISREGAIRYVNPYYLKLTGFERTEVVGKNWFMGFIPDSETRQVYDDMLVHLSDESHAHYKNQIITKAGNELSISWSNVVLYDDKGLASGIISIGADITEVEHSFDEIESLKSKLELENVMLKAELGQGHTSGEITGKSDLIQYVILRAGQVAFTETTVLLEGETGVGKEMVANFIQSHSKRKDKAFVKINCSALPSSLLESELFGHVKGAFTGAEKNKKGMVELADGGTLFLDEIGEIPLELQSKLLRFLQNGEFMPLGSEIVKRVDVRIITATNRVLLDEIKNGRFRDDLYYRISVYPITVPALRNRKEDIPEFTEIFVRKYAKSHGRNICKISKTAIDQLVKYSWPGNIRELENVIERAIILCTSDTIKLKDIPLQTVKDIEEVKGNNKILTLQEMEKAHILKALKAVGWKIHGESGAAEILGINPNTLRSRMKKLKITKPF